MAQLVLPAWINKPASEASAAERHAFVALGKDDSNLPIMKAALERDAEWVAVKSNDWATPGTALHLAAINNASHVTKFLLEYRADVSATDITGWTPLHYAASNGHVQVSEILLAAGADPMAKDNDGWPPLHKAAWNGHVQVAEILLAAGADPLAEDNNGQTPLHRVGLQGHVQVAELLLAAGADPLTKDNDGITPLHDAVSRGHVQVAELLLAAGADLLAKDRDSRTPLHWAAFYDHAQVAELLLAAGADPFAKNRRGDTPADVARRRNNLRFPALLHRWNSILNSHQELAELVTTTLRRDPTSYFSFCPLDLLEYLVAPMIKNMRGFKMASTDATPHGAEAQLLASAVVPAPIVKNQ